MINKEYLKKFVDILKKVNMIDEDDIVYGCGAFEQSNDYYEEFHELFNSLHQKEDEENSDETFNRPSEMDEELKQKKELFFQDWKKKFIDMLKEKKDIDAGDLYTEDKKLQDEFYSFIDVLMFIGLEANKIVGEFGTWSGERVLFNHHGYKFYARIINGQGCAYQLFDYESHIHNDWFKEVVIKDENFEEVQLD